MENKKGIQQDIEKRRNNYLIPIFIIISIPLIIALLITAAILIFQPYAKSCEYDGKRYSHMEKFTALDSCNTCTCNDGKVNCTNKCTKFESIIFRKRYYELYEKNFSWPEEIINIDEDSLISLSCTSQDSKDWSKVKVQIQNTAGFNIVDLTICQTEDEQKIAFFQKCSYSDCFPPNEGIYIAEITTNSIENIRETKVDSYYDFVQFETPVLLKTSSNKFEIFYMIQDSGEFYHNERIYSAILGSNSQPTLKYECNSHSKTDETGRPTIEDNTKCKSYFE